MEQQKGSTSKEMIWALRWSVALRTFYRQILSLLYSSFPFGNFRPRLVRALLVNTVCINWKFTSIANIVHINQLTKCGYFSGSNLSSIRTEVCLWKVPLLRSITHLSIQPSKAPGNQQEQKRSIAVPPIHVHGPARPAQGPKLCIFEPLEGTRRTCLK